MQMGFFILLPYKSLVHKEPLTRWRLFVLTKQKIKCIFMVGQEANTQTAGSRGKGPRPNPALFLTLADIEMEVMKMPLTPKNRKEEWLNGLVQHETTLTPRDRQEAWCKEIIDASGGGGGGTGGGVLVCTIDDETGALDKTAKEIYDAMDNSIVLFKASTIPADGVVYDTYSYVCSRTIINNSLYAFTYGNILADFPYDGFENAPFSGNTYPILSVAE